MHIPSTAFMFWLATTTGLRKGGAAARNASAEMGFRPCGAPAPHPLEHILRDHPWEVFPALCASPKIPLGLSHRGRSTLKHRHGSFQGLMPDGRSDGKCHRVSFRRGAVHRKHSHPTAYLIKCHHPILQSNTLPHCMGGKDRERRTLSKNVIS